MGFNDHFLTTCTTCEREMRLDELSSRRTYLCHHHGHLRHDRLRKTSAANSVMQSGRKYSRPPPPRTPPPRVPIGIQRGPNSRFVHKTHHDLRDHHLERKMDEKKKIPKIERYLVRHGIRRDHHHHLQNSMSIRSMRANDLPRPRPPPPPRPPRKSEADVYLLFFVSLSSVHVCRTWSTHCCR